MMETAANYKLHLEIAADAEELAHKSVELFVSDALRAFKDKGVFHVAVSGGHTPRRFFELLGELPEAKSLPWNKIHLFWVDERYVPPESPLSNYRLVAETFLGRGAIPGENV